MSEKGWKKVDRIGPKKRRIIKETYENYPAYEALMFLAEFGLMTLLIFAGAFSATATIENAYSLLTQLSTIGIVLGFVLMLPYMLTNRSLRTVEVYVPEEDEA